MLEETAYYVRVLQEESLAVGGDPLRCERDEEGNCTKINICTLALKFGVRKMILVSGKILADKNIFCNKISLK